jgi:hypothetical protein
VVVYTAGVDDGDAGANGVAADDGGITDLDALHIGDGVTRTGHTFEENAEVTSARFGHGASCSVTRVNRKEHEE